MNHNQSSRAGFLAASAILSILPANADLTNRWSFSNPDGPVPAGTIVTDTVGGQNAVVRGQGASFNTGRLTLPGTTTGNQSPSAISAYVDLPNGIISSKTSMSVEIWATPHSHKNFQRLLEFGRVVQAGDGLGAPGEITGLATTAPGTTEASDSLTLTLSRDTNLSQQRFEGKLDGANNNADPAGLYRIVDTNLATAANTAYHYVMTFENGGGTLAATGGRLSWYRNAQFVASADLGFRLNEIEDVNNWLGRSLWSGDACSHVSYDEVRLYDHAMGPAEIEASRILGPTPLPVAQADSVTMHHHQKAAIAVLPNDTLASSAVIETAPDFGTATVTGSGRILYSHTTGSPTVDSFTYRATNFTGQSSPVTVTINFTSEIRIATTHLNVPSDPPPTNYQLVEAFGSLSFTDPVCLATPPGETQRLFVCQKGGLLRMIPDVTAATPTASTFLNLPSLLTSRSEAIATGSEQGLLGLAFHPDYASNGYFFIFYCVTKGGVAYIRISRFSVQPGNPNAADTSSEVILIEQRNEVGNHNGGDLHFGPIDKYLYVSLGDEGNSNDTLNNSQRITKDFFSSILRIDVDKKPGNLEPNLHPNPAESSPSINAVIRHQTAPGSGVFLAAYSIPIDNPFVHANDGGTWNGSFNGSVIASNRLPYVRSEFWTVGMRNPWRISFDVPPEAPSVAELWVADVGQGAREEINIVQKGGNYGWNFREGFIARPGSGTPPDGFVGLPPIYDYRRIGDNSVNPNLQGNSVTGGLVYRGTRISALTGAYIFADYVSGHVWTLRRNGAAAPTVERIAGQGGIVAFGKDPSNGDVLLANLSANKIRRLVAGTPSTSFPATLDATGLFADLTDLSPNPGVLPYTVNLPFWSDHALKRRWFTIPSPLDKMSWSRDASWTFPAGQIWIKHFDLPLVRSNPPQPGDPQQPSKRIETRLLVKNATGSYGVSYRWNDAGTEATLVPDEGEAFDINITRNGSPYAQRWNIPSRAECSICHTPQASHALSMNTRQLNLSEMIHGFGGNQIVTLQNGGYFSNNPEPPNTIPRHLRPTETSYPAEARVRSYLDVNCAYCHKSGGTAGVSAWDGRIELTLDQTGIINGNAANNGGDPLNKLIVPGDLAHSIIYNRLAVTNGFTRMPPAGSNELDQANLALLTEWINKSLPARQTYEQWKQANLGSVSPAEGAPSADADADGNSNYSEYLAGTDPLDGSSFPALTPTIAGDQFHLHFDAPANRSVQMQISPDLVDWTFWNVPGNQGLPHPGGPILLQGPSSPEPTFFRAKISEN